MPQGMKKLIAGRTDLYVGPEMVLTQLLQSEELRQFFQTKEAKGDKVRVAGVLEEIALHAYVHQTHHDLAPQLSTVLKAMKEEGLIEQYRALIEEETSP